MHVCGRALHVFSFSLTVPCRLMIVFFFKLFLSAANQRDPSNSSVGSACLSFLFSWHFSLPPSHAFQSGIFLFVSERLVNHISGCHHSQSLNATSFSSAVILCLECGTFHTVQTLQRKLEKHRKIPTFKMLHVSPSHLIPVFVWLVVLLIVVVLVACWGAWTCCDSLAIEGKRRLEARQLFFSQRRMFVNFFNKVMNR